jgi:hypothetical protein
VKKNTVCLSLQRSAQRVSHICKVWSSLLVTFASVALFASVLNWLNWLQFINYLSFVKMGITLSKARAFF